MDADKLWSFATEPPAGRTQETIVCTLLENNGRYAIVVECRNYRPGASYKRLETMYDSGYRFTKRENARKRGMDLKADYIQSADLEYKEE